MKSFGASVQQGKMKATPMDILVDYDIMPRDGSVPGGNFNAATWNEMFRTIATDPELRQSFDIVKMFKYISMNLGAKNTDDFTHDSLTVQPQLVPDQDIAGQVAAGNIVPATGVV